MNDYNETNFTALFWMACVGFGLIVGGIIGWVS